MKFGKRIPWITPDGRAHRGPLVGVVRLSALGSGWLVLAGPWFLKIGGRRWT